MKRTSYFNYCEEKLNTLCYRLSSRASVNILDLHIHSEDFFSSLLNLVYDFSFVNSNQVLEQNSAGIDLIDVNNLLLCQVSGTATKTKIESSLSKNLTEFNGYRFKFLAMVNNASALRKQSFINPHTQVLFDASKDIHCCSSLLKSILHADCAKQKSIYELVKGELSTEEENGLESSNIAMVINILSDQKLYGKTLSDLNIKSFNLDDKITFNNLNSISDLIEDYTLYHDEIDSIYTIFDEEGKNKSRSILHFMKASYLKLKPSLEGEELFFQLAENIIDRVKGSANYRKIAFEELEMCVTIVMVDAFIRCRIFEKPPKVC